MLSEDVLDLMRRQRFEFSCAECTRARTFTLLRDHDDCDEAARLRPGRDFAPPREGSSLSFFLCSWRFDMTFVNSRNKTARRENIHP